MREFKEYGIVQTFWGGLNTPKGYDSADMVNFIRSHHLTGWFALTEGTMRLFQDIDWKRTKSLRFDVPPPMGHVKDSDIYNCVRKNSVSNIAKIKIFDLYAKNDETGSVSSIMVAKMSKGVVSEGTFWMLCAYARFISDQSVSSTMTFKEYCVNKEKIIEKDFRNLAPVNSKNFFGLGEIFRRGKSLDYRSSISSKARGILDSMTKDDVVKIVLNYENDPVTDTSYTKSLETYLQEIRCGRVDSNTLEDSYTKAMLESLDEFGSGRMSKTEILFDYTGCVINFVDDKNSMIKNSIAESLHKISRKITPVELMCVVVALSHPECAFRSCNKLKALEIVDKALKDLDDPVSFVIFLSESMFDYNGELASYQEWMAAIKENGDQLDLGPIVGYVTMIRGERKAPRKIPEYLKDFRKRYSRWAGSEDDEKE